MKRNTGQVMLIAGNDAAFQAAQDINNLGGAIDGSYSATLTGSKDVSTQVSGNNISIRAGQDVVTKGAQIVAEGALGVTAGRDVRIETANESGGARDEHQHSSGGLLTATSVKTDDSSSYSRNVGSTFSGNTVAVRAGNDVNITGSDVVSTQRTALAAAKMTRMYQVICPCQKVQTLTTLGRSSFPSSGR